MIQSGGSVAFTPATYQTPAVGSLLAPGSGVAWIGVLRARVARSGGYS